MSHIGLSKSKYAAYCQCPKLLWLSQYRTDEATPDAQVESRMEIGIQVGEQARAYFEGTVSAIELYPDGSQNRTAMLKRTQQLIDAATPVIAEAAFSYDGNYCAVDLLRYTPEGWIIYEVKSTTADSSEDEAEDRKNELIHTLDIAYQRWVLEQCGIKVSGTHLLALDKNYRLADTIDLHGLFADLDYADKVAEYYPAVANGVADAKRILQGTEPRIIAPTDNCTKKCAFWAYCTKHMPAKNPFSIMGMQFRTARKYYEQGYETFETLRTAQNSIRVTSRSSKPNWMISTSSNCLPFENSSTPLSTRFIISISRPCNPLFRTSKAPSPTSKYRSSTRSTSNTNHADRLTIRSSSQSAVRTRCATSQKHSSATSPSVRAQSLITKVSSKPVSRNLQNCSRISQTTCFPFAATWLTWMSRSARRTTTPRPCKARIPSSTFCLRSSRTTPNSTTIASKMSTTAVKL